MVLTLPKLSFALFDSHMDIINIQIHNLIVIFEVSEKEDLRDPEKQKGALGGSREYLVPVLG